MSIHNVISARSPYRFPNYHKGGENEKHHQSSHFHFGSDLTVGCAGRTKPIYNVENQTIDFNLTMEQGEKAIIKSGAQKKWKMMIIKPGQIVGNTLVSLHKARIQIDYTEKFYAITYLESENLLYKEGKIHRNYNRWINNLDQMKQSNLFDASLN